MKKNVMMRLASVLLIAVMMTTCAISGTFAKYVTNGTATDSARVAKWGVTVVADGTNTFGGIYKSVANGNTLNTSYTFGTDTVKSEGGNVVAPGTKGTVAGLTINGQPEVDTEVTFTADVTLENWTVGSAYYCPLVVTVTTTDINGTVVTTPIYGMVYGSMGEFEAAIEAEVLKAAQKFEAGTPINDNALSIAWEWPFESGYGQDNAKDTALGDAGTPARVTIAVTAIVTQVD